MNQVNLIGRITKKPEIRYTQNNKGVCEFNIAVNRIGQDQADFITCVVWDKQADNLCKYQDKGNQIAVSGALRVDTFEKEGQRKYKTYVLVNNIEYLGTKKDENAQFQANVGENISQNAQNNQNIGQNYNAYEDMGEQVKAEFTDDDLPF